MLSDSVRSEDGIVLTRRMISVVSAVSVFVGLAGSWVTISGQSPWSAVLVMVGFLVTVAAIVAILAVNRRAVLRRLDVLVLVAAMALFVVENTRLFASGYVAGNDETFLGEDALRALVRGHNPYALSYPSVLTHSGLTPLLGGGAVTHYEYPPLTLELGWLANHVWAPLSEPYALTAVALVATAAVVFVALPESVRVLAVPVVLGFGLLAGYTDNGYPVIIALPFLAVVAWRWTSIGAGGRLGLTGVGQAVALGIASSAHQLAWCFAAFAVLAVWRVRSGELGTARTSLVLARFAGIAVATFVVLDLPFIVAAPGTWFAAVSSVFTQKAVPFGVGLITLTVSVFGRSGALEFYGYATAALTLALLVITACAVRTVARAVPVFVAVMFLLSTRSTADYVVVFTPLWLVWLATTDEVAVAGAAPLHPRIAALLSTAPRRAAAVVVAVAPALGLAAVALFTSAPLSFQPTAAVVVRQKLHQLTVEVDNRTAHDVRPSYFVGERADIATRWSVRRGPTALGPHQRAQVVLRPVKGPTVIGPELTLYTLSADPSALSSSRVDVASIMSRTQHGSVALSTTRRDCNSPNAGHCSHR